MLREIVSLFVVTAPTLSADSIEVFDGILLRLIGKVDEAALIELSASLASLPSAPPKVVNQLARHRAIAVAGPLLRNSALISEETLGEAVKSKVPALIDAVASRSEIPEAVTDLLVELGDSELARKVARHPGARIGVRGFVRLIKRAETEPALAAEIAQRPDVPDELRAFLRVPAA